MSATCKKNAMLVEHERQLVAAHNDNLFIGCRRTCCK